MACYTNIIPIFIGIKFLHCCSKRKFLRNFLLNSVSFLVNSSLSSKNCYLFQCLATCFFISSFSCLLNSKSHCNLFLYEKGCYIYIKKIPFAPRCVQIFFSPVRNTRVFYKWYLSARSICLHLEELQKHKKPAHWLLMVSMALLVYMKEMKE